MKVYMQGKAASLEANQSNINPEALDHWYSFDKWQKLFLYFWFFSVIGQVHEIIWWNPRIETAIPLAPPYGLGVVAVILYVIPLIKEFRLKAWSVFGINVIVTGLVEYLCAAFVVVLFGYNRFWDYSDRFLNINGFICLDSVLLFGIMATVFIYFLYPICEKFFGWVQKKHIGIVFWFLFIFFIVDMVRVNLL